MSARLKILDLLADGHFHSGTEMGEILGVSRAAINKTIKSLQTHGIEIHSVTGKGYRIINPQAPLSVDKIRSEFNESETDLANIHILDEVDSTNAFLLRLAKTDPVSGHICLSESQQQGRGRRGKHWIATAYQNIIMSIAWQFQSGPAALGGLSLVAGVAVANALKESGIDQIKLKWPNDIILENKKLGGLLIEIQGESSGPCLAVLGIGINVDLGNIAQEEIDQPWTDIRKATDIIYDRNQLAASLIRHLSSSLTEFETRGFEGFRERWLGLHAYSNQPVKVIQGEREHFGVISNIGKDGALFLRDEHGAEQQFFSGEVSLRPLS
jgi:BirA family biotin operon repressor/biotin-[acetyl-CoA-carboxylase] ligase